MKQFDDYQIPTPSSAPTDPTDHPPSEPSQPVTSSSSRRENITSIISTILILLVAPLIAFVLTSFVFQSYEVDGPSMETTLQNHDRLIVLKTARTWSRITGHDYVPHRGDVIIFVKRGLYEFGEDKEKQLIKRVIGLPGERLVVDNDTITVYNKDHPEGFQPDKQFSYGQVIMPSNQVRHLDLTVGEHEIYVCGDNRGNSLDSRYFGPVPLKDVVGKLKLRIFPLNKAVSF